VAKIPTGGDQGLSFGRGRFMEFLKDNNGKSFEDQQRLLEEPFMDYKRDQDQLDEVTVLIFSAQGVIRSGVA
jgi:hypothetical protein